MPEIVPITIDNRIVRFRATPEQIVKLKKYFRYYQPGAEFSDQYKAWVAAGRPEICTYGLWDGSINLLKQGRVAAGLFFDQYKTIKAGNEFKFQVEQDNRVYPKFSTLDEYDPRLKELVEGKYAFQAECVEAMIRASRVGGIVLAATGTGKTATAGILLARLQGSGCFVVDELTLMDQAIHGLGAILKHERVGRFGGGFTELRRITVATAQTLQRRYDDPQYRQWFKSQDVVIIDELHVALNQRSVNGIHAMNPKAVFGLTATLELDKPHVRFPAVALTGPPIFKYPLSEGVKAGVLARSIVVLLQFTNNRTVVGDYNQEYRELISHNHSRNNCIEELCRAGLKLGMSIVVLVRRRAHLYALSNRLRSIPHKALCGLNKTEERVAAQQAMEADELKLIIASEIFAKGVNIRAVSLILDCTGAPSSTGAAQRHGRGTRTLEGKTGLVHIDISDHGSSRFSKAAQSRANALQALKVPVIRIIWVAGQAPMILQQAIAKLETPKPEEDEETAYAQGYDPNDDYRK